MIVIKIGGNMVAKLNPRFFNDIEQLQANGESIILVHGGGNLISECGEFIGQEPQKINGIRVTNPQMMSITDNVLTHIIQPELQRQFQQHHILSTMLNAQSHRFMFGNYIDKHLYGEVGNVNKIDAEYIKEKTNDSVGLCASIAFDPNGQMLNVNADTAAAALAELLHAQKLIFLTDVSNVFVDNKPIEQLNRKLAEQLVDDKTLTNGMIPKVKAAFEALKNGINQISITNDLMKTGTMIVK